MRLLALSGQRRLALAQYDRCRRLLNEALDVEPVPETIALVEQIRVGLLHQNKTAKKSGKANTVDMPVISSPNHLPPFQAITPPPHFVGREAEIEQLRFGLQQLGPKLYALVGMGGVGKTTLTTQLANTVYEAFPDGVLWENAATSHPLDILAAWARAYDYDFMAVSF